MVKPVGGTQVTLRKHHGGKPLCERVDKMFMHFFFYGRAPMCSLTARNEEIQQSECSFCGRPTATNVSRAQSVRVHLCGVSKETELTP